MQGQFRSSLKASHENVTDLLIRLELPEREQEIHYEFHDVKNAALECLAHIKVNLNDQEIDGDELISQSLRFRKSASSFRPPQNKQQSEH